MAPEGFTRLFIVAGPQAEDFYLPLGAVRVGETAFRSTGPYPSAFATSPITVCFPATRRTTWFARADLPRRASRAGDRRQNKTSSFRRLPAEGPAATVVAQVFVGPCRDLMASRLVGALRTPLFGITTEPLADKVDLRPCEARRVSGGEMPAARPTIPLPTGLVDT